MRRQRAIPALLASAAILACSKSNPCSSDNLKLETLNFVGSWYLYPDLLPPLVNLDDFNGPDDLLFELTAAARARGVDRFWSYTTTPDAQSAFFDQGTFVGFGVNLLIRTDGTGSHLFVAQVYAGSAAEAAGFVRGDEIVALGEADPLTPVSTLVSGLALEDANRAVGAALGPATVGVQRSFDVIPFGANPPNPVRRTMSKATYNLDPVPMYLVIDRSTLIPPLPPAGYVALRSFITPAEAPLQAAFAAFQAAGVKDVVVDLRYNGGGRIATAELLTNLLGGALVGKSMVELDFSVLVGNQVVDSFGTEANALAPDHVAFLVSGASASSSELVPNALAPYLPVLLVGHQTDGKPVGQVTMTDTQCGLVVNLVAFYIRNSAGKGDYFTGLPYTGFPGCAVSADDDLTKQTWDPTEGQTAAALAMLQTLSSGGACTSAPAPFSVASADSYPQAAQPSEAQRVVPGLF